SPPNALRKEAGIDTRFFASTLLSKEERNMPPFARLAPAILDGAPVETSVHGRPNHGRFRDIMGGYGKQRDVSGPLTIAAARVRNKSWRSGPVAPRHVDNLLKDCGGMRKSRTVTSIEPVGEPR